ncbi:hypothetical protein TNCV_97821 [Trichonephila clavipes]|nr:hypothetical protein TNCV_97821 [Trichonephila clavipes]
MIFFRNHKNCSKEHPPAKMQASHQRRRNYRTLANTPDISDIACYDGNPCNQGLVGVDGTCLNTTFHMAPEE